MVAIALHNIPEGAVPFAATMISIRAGVITAIAIALHNIPEGMAVSTAVLAMGGTRRRALAYTGVSVLGEVAGALLILVGGGPWARRALPSCWRSSRGSWCRCASPS